jgi:glycosyltransferase involved in cell wall biosynthesis
VPDAKAPVTAVVVTRNEEANIEACLQTLDFVSEIIVVDSESSDRTVQLARRYTNRVLVRPWPGRCEQLNHAATLAAHDWVLVVDADERVTPELAAEIVRRVPATEASAFRNTIREYMFGGWLRHGGWEQPNYIRLYRRDRATWHGYVHTEKVAVNGLVEILDGDMLHYSHITINHFLRKMENYTDLEARYRSSNLRRARLWLVLPRFLYTFVGRFIYRQGWRDGGRGFAIAFLMSVYYSLEEIKLWELGAQKG